MCEIMRNFDRPDAALIEEFSKMPSATVHEAMGKKGALHHSIRPVWPETLLCGAALTVYARPGDNLMLHKAVSIAQPGDILVVFADGFMEAGLWGEIITVAAIEKGIRGIVTDGSVRDTVRVRELGFPVFSAGISMRGTTKQTPGEVNRPITLGGILINPGDIILGDNDGVVVVPLADARKILQAAKDKNAFEAGVMDRIRNGESTMDILGFQKAYDLLGLSEERS